MDRASDCGSEGCRFESRRVHQKFVASVMNIERKPKKPKKTSKYFTVLYEGGSKKQRKEPVGNRHYELFLITQRGLKRWRMKIASLDDTDRDILLYQFVGVQLGRKSFKRDELPGVSISDLIQGLPFARKLREQYLHD